MQILMCVSGKFLMINIVYFLNRFGDYFEGGSLYEYRTSVHLLRRTAFKMGKNQKLLLELQ